MLTRIAIFILCALLLSAPSFAQEQPDSQSTPDNAQEQTDSQSPPDNAQEQEEEKSQNPPDDAQEEEDPKNPQEKEDEQKEQKEEESQNPTDNEQKEEESQNPQEKEDEQSKETKAKKNKDNDLSFPYRYLGANYLGSNRSSSDYYWGTRVRLMGGLQQGWIFDLDNQVPYNSLRQGFWLGADILIDIVEKNIKKSYPIYSGGLVFGYSQTGYSFTSASLEEKIEGSYSLGFVGIKGGVGWRFPLTVSSKPSALQLQATTSVAVCLGYDDFQKTQKSQVAKIRKSLSLFPCLGAGLEITMYFFQRISFGIDSSFLYYVSPVQIGKTGSFHNLIMLSTISIGWVF